MSIKYQIFISSTYEDLKDEREQVIKAVLEMGHIPVGMEMFSAGDEEQWKLISRQIDEVDYYVVIIGHRYGSLDKSGISYTEKEYDYAIKQGVPALGFIIDDNAPWPKTKIENEEAKKRKLDKFKNIAKSKLVHFWINKEDLHGKVSISLMKTINTNPRVGWTKANEVAGPEVMKELTRLSSENANLRTEITKLQHLKENPKDELKEVMDILYHNTTNLYVRESQEWGEPIESNLLRIFEAIAPNMMVENTPEEMAKNIALEFKGLSYNPYWPVPQNYLTNWLADFSSLEIIEPSKKKHSLKDKNEYWCLTKLGKNLLKNARRIKLSKGLKTSVEEAPTVKTKKGSK